jgi:predicted AAA+ superfamily ATPase
LFKEYLDFSSFPEVVLKEEKERILKEYYDAIFFKDFVERHKLKSFSVANLIFSYFFQNFSAEISVNRIVDFFKSQGLKMGKNTIYDYVEKLQDTLAIFFIRKFSKKVSIRELWPKKVYICDTGISRILRFSENIGKMMENAVFLELLRTINTNPLLEIFYWKDYQQNEVDFIIKEGLNVKQLIQVSYASSKDEIEKREIKALIKASEQLNCKDLLIITWDYDDELKINNKKIVCKPLWEWFI